MRAVVGVLLKPDTLRTYVSEHMPECADDTDTCYLLDDAGYIIMSPSNDTDHQVKFLHQFSQLSRENEV